MVGNEQKFGAFWKRIQAYFNNSLQLIGPDAKEASQCKQRWGRLNEQVCKFVGCFEAAKNEQTRGRNKNDLMKAVQEIFYNDYQESSAQSPSYQDEASTKEVSQARLGGVKAAKAGKAKRNGMPSTSGTEAGKALVELQSLWDIKKQDLEMKQQLSRQKLLENLLAKNEPLSDIEMALKHKLITEMLL
ncbi:glutathione S-transferase T3-like [Eutrema salsugineum]|uniref:glutathione S-transferase T3-like n=1 Tax=Eutrema salsugineum TaxID=72664 RepID=UPI000CED2C0A|nr:glutathione S-transferase T3-like [Eutrema salsugineum]